MKNITIAGTVGRDAETRDAGQSRVTSWSVAVDDRQRGGEKGTIWFDCSMWGQRGEKLAQYIQKGGKVAVSGEFGTREHNGKTYMQINVSDVTLQGGGQQSSGYQSGESQTGGWQQGGAPAGGSDIDDEIQF